MQQMLWNITDLSRLLLFPLLQRHVLRFWNANPDNKMWVRPSLPVSCDCDNLNEVRGILFQWRCFCRYCSGSFAWRSFTSSQIPNKSLVSALSHPAAMTLTTEVHMWSGDKCCTKQMPFQTGFNPPQQMDWLNVHSIRFGFFMFTVRTQSKWIEHILNMHSVSSEDRPLLYICTPCP